MSDAGEQYLLQDGTYASPGDCAKGADGVLRHENGVPVALRDDGKPMTLGKVTEHNVAAAAAAAAPAPGEPVADAAAAEPPATAPAPTRAPAAPARVADMKADEAKPAAARDVKAD